MSEALIRAEIKDILEGVSGIGVVHDYERMTRSLANYLNLMTSGGKVNGWTIHREATESKRLTMGTVDRFHHYRITGIYELDDENGSEDDFQGLIESVFMAFKNNPDLNGQAITSELVNIESVTWEEYGQRFYHQAELILVANERI